MDLQNIFGMAPRAVITDIIVVLCALSGLSLIFFTTSLMVYFGWVLLAVSLFASFARGLTYRILKNLGV